MATPDPNPADVKADDALIEDLRAGAQPPTSDQIATALAAMRDHAQEGT